MEGEALDYDEIDLYEENKEIDWQEIETIE
jgi:hypothetical protein